MQWLLQQALAFLLVVALVLKPALCIQRGAWLTVRDVGYDDALEGDDSCAPSEVRLALTSLSGEVRISWRAPHHSCAATVQYGRAADNSVGSHGVDWLTVAADHVTYDEKVMCAAPSCRVPFTVHQRTAVLQGLEAHAQYAYLIAGAKDPVVFRAPLGVGGRSQGAQRFSFVAFGDMGEGHLRARKNPKALDTVRSILHECDRRGGVDLILHTGDLSYANARPEVWTSWMNQIQPLSSQIPYMVVVGNHEGGSSHPKVYLDRHHGHDECMSASSSGSSMELMQAEGRRSQEGSGDKQEQSQAVLRSASAQGAVPGIQSAGAEAVGRTARRLQVAGSSSSSSSSTGGGLGSMRQSAAAAATRDSVDDAGAAAPGSESETVAEGSAASLADSDPWDFGDDSEGECGAVVANRFPMPGSSTSAAWQRDVAGGSVAAAGSGALLHDGGEVLAGFRPLALNDSYSQGAGQAAGQGSGGLSVWGRGEDSNPPFWYAFSYATVRFVMISTEHSLDEDSVQYQWLEAQLRGGDRCVTPWVVLSLHRPMYVVYPHKLNRVIGELLRGSLEPLLSQYKVDLALSGHVHTYYRTCAVDDERCVRDGAGTTHFVIGSGGHVLSGLDNQQPHWLAASVDDWGYVRFDVDGDSMHARFILSHSSEVADEVTLTAQFVGGVVVFFLEVPSADRRPVLQFEWLLVWLKLKVEFEVKVKVAHLRSQRS